MTGTIVDTWTFSPASLTLLLSDFGLGEMPRPFEVAHPYTTVSERAAFRAHTHRELTSAGLLRAGELDPDLERSLSALVAAPVGVVAMGTFPGGALLARGCWHRRGAVLARQHADTVAVTELGTTPLVEAITALIPDARPAGGTSVSVPDGGRGEREFTLFDDLPAPGTALAAVSRDPIVGCGAFVPFAGKRFLPPVTWFDTSGHRGTGRHFTTTTSGRGGTTWTTYAPGDRARIARSLREVVEPLLR